MTPELGHFGLTAALLFSCTQVLVGSWGIVHAQNYFIALVKPAQYAAFTANLIAFAGLIWAFASSDFSFTLVAQHSHTLKPLLYKISGTWGNHEGSLLLWSLILNLFGAMFCMKRTELDTRLVTLIATVQGTITAAFLSFSLFRSNPFARLDIPPIEGAGLNPVLQDIGLALHPPMLYLGYVGLSMTFSFAVAGLIFGDIDKKWAVAMRPWISGAWCALTAGIALGSWWAYYELGWGGWWFWDPVENASLMPWLVATALLHSVRVVEARGMFKGWTVLLAIIGFSLSLLGTFIVRSGLLTSVHSFASDPSRGIYILVILLLAIGIPLLLYLWRAPRLASPAEFGWLSREMSLLINNTILVSSMLIVLLGTFYPMGLELFSSKKISVGPPYFAATFNPVMALGMFGAGCAGIVAWRRGIFAHGKKTVIGAGLSACGVTAVLLTQNISAAALAGIALTVWLMSAILLDIFLRTKPLQPELNRRLRRLGLGVWGMWIAHFGIALFLAGALGEHLYEEEAIVRVQTGEIINLKNKHYLLKDVVNVQGPNFVSLRAELILRDALGNEITRLFPERRHYPAERQFTTEAAIRSTLWGDDYAVLGDGDPVRGYSLRIYHKPLITWIWLGSILLVIGGGIGAFGHRKRPESTIK